MDSRLKALMALVPEETAGVADIGYDHGKLMLALLVRDPALRVIGVERQAGTDARFFTRFRRPLARLGVGPTLRQGDGLGPLGHNEVDCAVIAGMGEGSMLRIIEARHGHGLGIARFILCPSHVEASLRPGMADMGYQAVDERLVFERGRPYVAIAFEKAAVASMPEAVLRYGPSLFARREPRLLAYLESFKERFAGAFENNLQGCRGQDGALNDLGTKLALIDEAIAVASALDSARGETPDQMLLQDEKE